MLTKWLPENEENMLPNYATRTAGISAIVIDDNNRILVIKEKYHPEWGYKMPSGAVEMGENLKDAAVREVKEETGVDTIFEESLVGVNGTIPAWMVPQIFSLHADCAH